MSNLLSSLSVTGTFSALRAPLQGLLPVILCLVLLGAEPAGAQTPAAVPAPTVAAMPLAGPAAASGPAPATLRLLNRELVTLRVPLSGMTPEERVRRAVERFRNLDAARIDLPLRAVPFALGQEQGMQFMVGNELLFSLLPGDVPEGASLATLTADCEARWKDIVRAWHDSRDRGLLLAGLLRTLGATLLLGVILWGVARGSRRLGATLEAARLGLARKQGQFDWRELALRLGTGCLALFRWLVWAIALYIWLDAVLSAFAFSKPWADNLGDWSRSQLLWIGNGMLSAIPGLVTVVIVLVVTRAIVDVLGYFFEAVQKGRLKLPWLHPETVSATRRIVTVLAWALGIAVAYPYLPGSNTEAFKGLSVLLGLMVTLGSTGLVTQAMSGLLLIYARALRKGDYVVVSGVEGVVTEVAPLTTKITNIRNEEITLPNAVLISSPIFNYSKLATDQGTLLVTKVSIGYDAPWRKVHAMLIEAADATEGVRKTPQPYVYQRALSDFYVEYELYCSIDRPLDRVPVLSRLNGHIQDIFNREAVQIMSPHFMVQPAQAVLGEVPARPAEPAR